MSEYEQGFADALKAAAVIAKNKAVMEPSAVTDFVDLAREFMLNNEYKDQDEVAENLGYLLSVIWEAGKFQAGEHG